MPASATWIAKSVLVARLVGPLATLFVDADKSSHRGRATRKSSQRRAADFFRKQKIGEHADSGLAVEHDLLAHVTGNVRV